MKDKIINLIGDSLNEFNVVIDDVFVEEIESKKVLNIVLDSDEVIDLNKVTEVSRIINKKIDEANILDEEIEEVDIYSKEKGDN
jgi:ribosome maturation factor RimP